MKKINYTGSSTIIKRLCEIVNELVDGGGSAVTSVNTKTGDVVLTTSDLQNDSGYITNVVNDLTNYYLKSETYTKTEVNNLIGTFVDIRVVSSLPTSDISQTTIYLVPKSVAQTNNLYDEYINLDGTSQGWEKIGDTQIDLSNYIQKSQTSGLVKNDGTIDTNSYSTTDENVKQTATTGNYDFRVLLSATATDGDYTGVVKKNTNLRYNASTGNFQVPKINGVDVGSAPEFTDIKVLYGICSTAASDSDKKVVLSGTTLTDAQYSSLPIGTFLAVKYDNTNSASNCTLSVVDDATNPTKYTTPASFYYNTGVVTDSNTNVCGVANRHTYYIWNGTYWVWCTRGLETTFSNMSKSELVTGTATTQRTVRADYLNGGIRELINSYGWATQGAVEISGTASQHYDLNTLITPGNYYVKNNTNAAYIDNRPTGSTETAFNLIVIRNLEKTNYYRQVAWTYNSPDFHIRHTTNSGSTWSSWTNLNTPKYLTEMNTSSVSSITNKPGNYKANIENIVSSATTGLFPAADNSNAILQVNRMNGNYDSQLGFSSNGELYYRSFNNEALNTTKYWGRLIKEYTFTKTSNHYAYFYLSLPSSGQITLEIDGAYYYSTNKTIVGMSANNGSWPLLEPTTTTWGDGAATKAWIGKTNNVPWIAVDTQGTILNVRLYAQSSEGASIIDFQSNATNPTSASDEYSGTYKTPTSSELYPDSPKVVRNKSSDTFLYSYDIKRVFLQVSYSGTWALNQSKDITAQFKTAIGDKLIRIISHSISVYDVESNNEKYNICGNFELYYFYEVNTIHEVFIINHKASLIGGTGSYVTILLEYIEL